MSKLVSSKKKFSINHDEAVDFYLRSAWLDVSRMYNEIALSHGLTMSMAFILINISKKGSNPTKLGPQMGMQANSLSRTLKSLEEKGLIVRQKSEDGDKREVNVYLTELGVEARKASNAIIAEFNEILYENISDEERQLFVKLISRVHNAVETMRERLGVNESDVTASE